MRMQLSPTEFKVLILGIGIFVGVAISFLAYSATDSLFSFIFVPICAGLIYFQMVHPIRKKE